jgi:superfamily I DNA/RNA helicase
MMATRGRKRPGKSASRTPKAPVRGSLGVEDFLLAYERASGHSLNEDQRAAVRHGEGPLNITAGPGSGKSEVMVARALKLVLVDGVDPASVLLTTFTEKAARNLQDRVTDRLLRMGYDTSLHDLRVGTLHSICDLVMRDYRYLPYNDTRLLDETEQSFFVYAHCGWVDEAPREFWDFFRFLHRTASLEYGPNKWQRAGTLVTLFNRLTDEEVDLYALSRARRRPLQQLGDATRDYRNTLRDKCRSDFATLQLHFKEFLETRVGETFMAGDAAKERPPLRHVLVDEYQDTNPIQETIYFRLVAACGGNITVVGDDDQALYRFRGATVECIVRFPDKCRDLLGRAPEMVQLRTNYRAVPAITRWAEAVIGAQPEMRRVDARAPKASMLNERPDTDDYPAVSRLVGQRHADVADAVADVIAELRSEGLVSDPSHIAILFKSSRESPRNAGPVADALRDRGIPVYNPRSKAFLETEEVAGMLGALLEILDRDNHVGGTLRGRMAQSIAEWRQAYADLAAEHDGLRRHIDRVHAELARRRAGEWLNVTLRDMFYRVLACPPFSEWQEDPNRTFRLGQISRLLESFASVEGNDTLQVSSQERGRFSHGWLRSRFYPRLIGYLHQASLDDPEDVDYEIKPGYVQIMTVHQSKGLEFPIVLVGSLDMRPDPAGATYELEDLFSRYSANPHSAGTPSARAVQDLVRFFYVAYTRAQDALVLFGTTAHFTRATIATGRTP